MPSVAVIGGGIAGLAAAYRLVEAGLEVRLFEASGRVGGVIRSEKVDGYLIEHGPNSIQSRSPELNELLADLGLEERIVEASDAARVRYIVRGGKPVAAPASPPGLITSGLFGAASKLRLLREPFVPVGVDSATESVAEFLRRRFGQEALDYGMNPFVAGVFAGDPERLSLKHAFPMLFELEQRYGSVIRGLLDRRREGTGEKRTMFSFDEGLEVLPQTLAAKLADRIATGARVTGLDHRENRWEVVHAGGSDAFDAVVYCAPLHRLSEIALPEKFEVSRMSSVRYPPLSVVAFGYRRAAVAHPLDGFGVLVPEVERDIRILGSLFTSSIFPHRAPAGSVLLTTFVGGSRAPEAARLPDQDIFDVAHEDLRTLLGISEAPIFRRRITWEHAIPQYEVGYDAVLDAIARLEAETPGWFMAGNFRRGIAVGDTTASGVEAARRCAAHLTQAFPPSAKR